MKQKRKCQYLKKKRWDNLTKEEKEARNAKISNANKGKPKSIEHRKKLSKSIAGKRWIQNGKETKLVNKDEIENYLNHGWNLGRIQKKRRTT